MIRGSARLAALKAGLELVETLDHPSPLTGVADIRRAQDKALDALVVWAREYSTLEADALAKTELTTSERQTEALDELAAISRRIA